MTNTPIQVTTDLSKVLERIETKLDNLQKDVNDLKIGQTKLETEISSVKEDVKDLKGSQKAQIWALIGIIATAVVGTLIRFTFSTLPKP
jgi:predicted nuclease with TOPRIM domain